VLWGHARLGARTPDDPDPIAQAAQAAAAADVAIVFAADKTSEGSDRTTLALPGEQNALIEASRTPIPTRSSS
jgi:beta-glucosidase